MSIVAKEPEMTLIDQLLAEQRSLTAVERFSQWHEGHQAPALESRYRSLLPANAPAQGQQYAFEVDLDVCSGCKACVTACHALNGLDDKETWRGVGLLVPPPATTEPDETTILQPASFHKHVTSACHHCADPGCLNGCPVLAYDKDPLTGIVRHLDDQCIGCQYCVMKCPYDVPKYSERLGIVRKCDMCANRLAVGEAPACVQACPNEAIRIAVVDKEQIITGYRSKEAVGVKSSLNANTSTTGGVGQSFDIRASSLIIAKLLPGTPDPAITAPTTRYVSRQVVDKLIPGNSHDVQPAKAHVPLSLMLVLTQAGVGMSLFEAVNGVSQRSAGILALFISLVGMIAGTLHLGQPLKAWRGFLGWRKSWLSRELIVFGQFLGVMGLHIVLQQTWTAWLAAATGVIAVFCSAMIYVDTKRPFWSAALTFPKFAFTSLLLGWVASLMFASPGVNRLAVFSITALLMVFKLVVECSIFANHQHEPDAPLSKTARLHQVRPLSEFFRGRLFAGVLGGIIMPLFWLNPEVPVAGLALLVFVFLLVGELLERHLFFVAEAARKMPGAI